MSLQSSLTVLIPSLIGVFLAIIVSAGVGCSHYAFGRAGVDPCGMANPEETFSRLCGSWKSEKDGQVIQFGKSKQNRMALFAKDDEYHLIRKAPGHYMFREGIYNWKGILITFLENDRLTVNTNDGHTSLSYTRTK